MANIELQVDGVWVGDGHPCFIIAEIGSNHNKDLELAFEHIDAAAEAGVNAVKFQTFKAVHHYSRKTPGFSYLNNSDTFNLIKSLELDRTWHGPLKEYAEKRGVVFFSSPCDVEAVAELQKIAMGAYKVASFDLPDTDLIRLMAQAGKPVILSTGMADWQDIQRAINACHDVGNKQVVLLQCTSLYPAPAELSNLRAMASMRLAFNKLVGFSDHTSGIHIALAAVAIGACIIEKHFTLDKNLPGPDHPFAIEPQEMKEMVHSIREVESAMGEGEKNGPAELEQEMYEKGRRSLHARKDINIGDILTEDNVVIKRPGLGIQPAMKNYVIGRRARVAIEADHWITWDMI